MLKWIAQLLPTSRERDLDAEIRSHFEIEVRRRMARGERKEAAEAGARREFGNVALVKETTRETWSGVWVRDALRDLRLAARLLVRSPGFALTAIISLALGIGATTAVYSTIDWLLNRSPGAVEDPSRLVALRSLDRNHPELGELTFSFPQYEDLGRVQDAFVDVAAYGKLPVIVSTGRAAEEVIAQFATGNYFDLLGVGADLGRMIGPEDDVADVPPVVVLSHAFWMTHFGGDRSVLGDLIRINAQAARIIGVAPREFEDYTLDWNAPTEVWVPVRAASGMGVGGLVTGTTTFFPIIGRMRPGMNTDLVRERAQTWVPLMDSALTAGQFQATDILVVPANEMRINRREAARDSLGTLLIVCGLILFGACFNIANFLLGRVFTRRHEMALRLALGATRERIGRQLLTEALVIGGIGGALGLVVAVVVARLLSSITYLYLGLITPTDLATDGAIDIRMAAVAVALGIGSAIVFGVLPAMLASVRNPWAQIRIPRSGWGWSRVRMTPRQAVLVLQVGVAVVLAVTAGLYARSFISAAGIDSEFQDPAAVLLARVRTTGLSAAERGQFYSVLLDRLHATPEVVVASIGWNPPYLIGRTFHSVPGREDEGFQAAATAASPRFFETHGIRLVAGSEFTGSEYEAANGLIVNEVLAERLWQETDVVGRPVDRGDEERAITGVVSFDYCNGLLDEPYPCAWQPFPTASSSGYLRIRTRGDPAVFLPHLKALVGELSPDSAITVAMPLDEWVGELTERQRVWTIASAALALLGMGLVAIGCVSLFFSMVKDSVHEIAIRMALGASHVNLTLRIVRQGVLVVALGIVAGLGASLFWTGRLTDQLYGVGARDTLTLTVVPSLILGIGLVSVCLAAVHATRTSPARALRDE